jgi:hypothetical protein
VKLFLSVSVKRKFALLPEHYVINAFGRPVAKAEYILDCRH